MQDTSDLRFGSVHTPGTLPNNGSEVSKPLRTQLGHFRIKVQKCSVDTSEVLFRGVQRTLPNLYSEVSYAMTFLLIQFPADLSDSVPVFPVPR